MSTREDIVFLVEDDEPTLRRLANIVSGQAHLKLAATASSYSEASLWLANNTLDVLLTDLGLPDGNGKQLIEQTRALYPNAEIMVISRFGDENSVVESIKVGASGYLLKDESEEYIREAIDQLLQGGSPISPAIARYILDYFQSNDLAGDSSDSSCKLEIVLTPKEKMVLQHLSRGYSNKEIANSLCISPHTVASHIKHIYRKLEVNSRNEAVFEGYKMGQICMHQHTQSTPTQKSSIEVTQALLMGKKSVTDVAEVLKLVFDYDLQHCIETLQLAGCDTRSIFVAARHSFQARDVVIIKTMITQGFDHEEVLQAVLASQV